MKKVKVDWQCPFCGLCKILKTAPHRKGIMCPACHQVIFLRWATGVEGYVDRYGYYFHAHEPFALNKINQEFEEAFEDEGDFKPRGFTIRQRLKE